MSTIIRNGTVVESTGSFQADIRCSEGRVSAIERGLIARSEDHEIDATGCLVFAGFIDPHVHSRDPGQVHKEDFWHSTRAAAAGGITTVLEMPNALPPVTSPGVFAERAAYLARQAHVDFGLWALLMGDESTSDLVRLRSAGVVAGKLFWGYAFDRQSGSLVYSAASDPSPRMVPPASNGDVWHLLNNARDADLLVGVHCEDASVVRVAERTLGKPGNPLDLAEARPAVAETVAVASLIELSRACAARVHVVHVSAGRSAELIRRAQADGVQVSAETCPHYLTLDSARPGAGAEMRVFPPVRGGPEAASLWQALLDRTITSIGSDHAPHSLVERAGPFSQQPAGIVGVETMARVLCDQVSKGRISWEQLAWCLSEGTARLFGLYPQKGVLRVGSDADITLVNPQLHWTIKNQELHSKQPLSPWHGMQGRGAPVRTILRGEVVMDHGQLKGAPTGRLARPLAKRKHRRSTRSLAKHQPIPEPDHL